MEANSQNGCRGCTHRSRHERIHQPVGVCSEIPSRILAKKVKRSYRRGKGGDCHGEEEEEITIDKEDN